MAVTGKTTLVPKAKKVQLQSELRQQLTEYEENQG